MKKYISAILINAILIQLVGCYTEREITYDEFYSMPKEQEANIIFNDEKNIELISDSLLNNVISWEKEPDTLIFYLTHYKMVDATTSTEITDTFKYPEEAINKIYIDAYDVKGTILGIAAVILLGVFIYLITRYSPPWEK
jgi:hypothetical protein